MIAASCAVGRSGSRSGANETIVSSTPRSPRTTSSAQNRLVAGSHSSSSRAAWIRSASSRCGAGSAPTISAISTSAWVDQRWIAVEERPGDEERQVVERAAHRRSRSAVARGQEDEGVVGRVRRPVGRIGVIEVVAPVGRDRAGRDDHLAEVAVPGRRVVEARLPRMHHHRQLRAGGRAAVVEVAALRGQPRVQPARGTPGTPRVARVAVHLERRPGVDRRLGDARRLDVARRLRRSAPTTARTPAPGSTRLLRPRG